MLHNELIAKMKHIVIVDRMIRDHTAQCRDCGSMMIVGEYEDPNKGDQMLDEWLVRHLHGRTL